MRKGFVLLVVALVAYGCTAATASWGAPLVAVTPICAVKAVNTASLVVRGGCRERGRAIPSRLSFRVASWDASGFSCGTVAKTTTGSRTLGILPGAAKIAGTVRYLPKSRYRKVISKPRKISRTYKGSPDLQCGAPVNLPLASALCPVTGNQVLPGYATRNCGQPTAGACAFNGPLSFNNGVLEVGHVSCPGGPCRYGPWRDGPGPGPFQDGFGGNFTRQRLLCADGLGAEVSFASVSLYDTAGAFCADLKGPYGGERSMMFPPAYTTWDGMLYAGAWVTTYRNIDSANKRPVASETETLAIQLTGTQMPFGCS